MLTQVNDEGGVLAPLWNTRIQQFYCAIRGFAEAVFVWVWELMQVNVGVVGNPETWRRIQIQGKTQEFL